MEQSSNSSSGLPDDFCDNAEVLVQVAQGESLKQMVDEGLWIAKGSGPTSTCPTDPKRVRKELPIKTATGTGAASSLPVDSSLEAMVKELKGYPILSHQLQQLINTHSGQQSPSLVGTFYEVDSLGLFFYTSPKSVKISKTLEAPYDPEQVLAVKRTLVSGLSLLQQENSASVVPLGINPAASLCISLENLEALASCLPSRSKLPSPAWIIPFEVRLDESLGKRTVNLAQGPIAAPCSTSHICAIYRHFSDRIRRLLPFSHTASYEVAIEDDLSVQVQALDPIINVGLRFRGATHQNPSYAAVASLFYREPNYNVDVDAEAAQICSVQLSMPKLDAQARIFTLLKALHGRLAQMPPNATYLLVHAAGTPTLKIVSSDSIFSDKPPFDMNSFKGTLAPK